jgi:hypothetical protein
MSANGVMCGLSEDGCSDGKECQVEYKSFYTGVDTEWD